MTTIAWDGKTLAADRQTSMFRGSTTKAIRLSTGHLFGASGDLRDSFSVREPYAHSVRGPQFISPVREGRRLPLCLDHDHKTMRARGLLCSECNNMLGYARDKPDTLIAAARYLEKHLAAEYGIEVVEVALSGKHRAPSARIEDRA